jgi:ADP-heptose:LPS heptosyltransferase
MQCSFMSLPRAFRTNRDTIPATVPYLSVPPYRLEAWRERLGKPDGRRRVAVAWTGASAVWNRNIPLERLAPLLRRDDCAFHIVQTDMEPGDREILRTLPHMDDHSRDLADFADTAAIVALMDLVITVDTVLGHIGGALARPVWAMLPFGAEYRWLTAGTTSAWYPTMRLFRQPALNDWHSVVAAVQAALDA